MAYRKTDAVIATEERKRERIINAAIKHIASKKGLEGFGTTPVAKMARIPVGVLYNLFGDKDELLAAAAGKLMQQDVEAIREGITGTPNAAVVEAIMTLIALASERPRLTEWLQTRPDYHEGVRAELAKLMKAAEVDNPVLMADVAFGAICSTAGRIGPRSVNPLAFALLRAAGLRAKAPA